MKPNKIVILTGTIQTGKSTALLQWGENKNVGGFLTVIVSVKRMLLTLPQKLYVPFEVSESPEQTITIGRYHLLADTFARMNQQLLNQTSLTFDWLIIDEVGPLELKGEGIYAGLMHVLNHCNSPILLVVREGLVNQVIEKFNLKAIQVITKDSISLTL